MKKGKIAFACLIFGVFMPAFAWGWNDYIIKSNPYNNFGSDRGIEMRPKYDYDPSHKYSGSIDRFGDAQLRNSWTGNTLRGNIDSGGYGKLRDFSGNTYRVKP